MAGYVGRGIEYGNAVADHFTGNGGATYTLTYDTTTNGVVVTLDGVVQKNGSDFNVTGTSLVFTSTVASPIAIQVIYTGLTLSIGIPADGTIGASKVSTGLSFAQITDSTVFFENWNTISSNQTTTLSSSKNMFVAGPISVTGSAVWTVTGTGNLNII